MVTAYDEESFGILTDDDLALDAVLMRPAQTADDDLQAIRVWVPRYPLTKASVITCARHEVEALGAGGGVAHLVFDLRGTGESEGAPGDREFARDLRAVRLWAEERFGQINIGFLGRPQGDELVDVRPIRPGVVMELYRYRPPAPDEQDAPAVPLLYLATYGAFSSADEAICRRLAQGGYDVLAMDPLRYLLHAAARERLTIPALWQDLQTLCEQLPEPPLLVGQPIGAGLALFWASGVERVRGVMAIGQAQRAFSPAHIFANSNPHTFFLGRYVHKIAPRPVALVRASAHPLGGSHDELSALHQVSGAPRRLIDVEQVSGDLLLELLPWLENPEDAG